MICDFFQRVETCRDKCGSYPRKHSYPIANPGSGGNNSPRFLKKPPVFMGIPLHLEDWLGGLDSNQDSQIQSLESYQLDDLPAEGSKQEGTEAR